MDTQLTFAFTTKLDFENCVPCVVPWFTNVNEGSIIHYLDKYINYITSDIDMFLLMG